MLDYKLTKFSNGLKVITAPLKNTRAMSILTLVGIGSRYEGERENGIAHFVEHMVFKGTKKRPKTADIAKELDAVGAQYNAFTGEEQTGFYVRAESSHFDLGLDILTDILNNSLFDLREIAKEKKVIIEEINMRKDIPMVLVENTIKELLWTNHPLGRMITGTKESVAQFNRPDFISFLKNHYQPQNMIVAVAGEGDHHEWLEKIQNYFKGEPGKPAKTFKKVGEKQKSPAVKVFYKETDQAHFIIGFRSLKRTDKRHQILQVLDVIMGNAMSSRLFNELRERRGLCYYISSDLANFIDNGFWGVSAGVDIKRIDEAIKVILAEFTKLKSFGINNEELKRAQENLKGHLYINLEESMDVAEFLAEQELFWHYIDDPDKVAADWEKVSEKDIRDLATAIFRPANLNLAIVGPFRDEKKFKKILSSFA